MGGASSASVIHQTAMKIFLILQHWPRFLPFLAIVALTGCSALEDPMVNLNPFRNPTGPAKIVIDLGEQRAWLYRGREVAAVSRISSGREGFDTPTGRFKVIQKDIDHRSSLYGAYVLKGTRKIVVPDVNTQTSRPPRGTTYIGAPMPYFLRFQGGHGLHAGDVPNYPASHGCIRLPYSMAKKFYIATRIGTPVIVKR